MNDVELLAFQKVFHLWLEPYRERDTGYGTPTGDRNRIAHWDEVSPEFAVACVGHRGNDLHGAAFGTKLDR
jgi:hypothetical protein